MLLTTPRRPGAPAARARRDTPVGPAPLGCCSRARFVGRDAPTLDLPSPSDDGDRPGAAGDTPPCRAADGGRAILLVEDNDFGRAALTHLLRVEGYRVTEAANGREALAGLHVGDLPDLILLDLLMPVLDGWEFCRQRDEDPRLAEIPVLVVSSTDPGSLPAGAPPGIAGFLRKPVPIEELLSSIRQVC